MSQPWWVRERPDSAPRDNARLADGEFGKRPVVHPDAQRAVLRQLRQRRATYTPEWQEQGDAGAALAELFSQQLSPVLRRLNRLPDKTRIEFLNLAGIQPTLPRSAQALVQFNVSPAARESVSVLEGFQLGARAATGEGDLVVFETNATCWVTPASIAKVIVIQGSTPRDVTAENGGLNGAFAPFGDAPELGDALALGIGGAASITETISLGIQVNSAPGAPPPFSTGGVAPVSLPAAPVLRWEALVGAQFEPLIVVSDETSSLWRSGIVQLKAPRPWAPAAWLGDEPLFWLRLRLVQGAYAKPPSLQFVRLNMVRADAVRTIRDEVLTAAGDNANQMRLQYRPVVPDSLELAVDAAPLDFEDDATPDVQLWKQVEDLATASGMERVYMLDAETGILTFGDGIHGAPIPSGFRNVRAVRYRVASGAEGAVGADEIKNLLNAAQFVTSVTNPLPASGGVAGEAQRDAILGGPALLQARSRAVSAADYTALARRAPGANVRRAHALPGYHPSFPGTFLPGVVSVLVAPETHDSGPPIPDEATLRAVGDYLSRAAAPAGIEIVTAAPTYRFLRTEIEFVADPTADFGAVARQLTATLDRYFHPLTGGADETGWPFGGTLEYSELVVRSLRLNPKVFAFRRLQLVLDGVPRLGCTDIHLAPTELFWPERHQLIPVAAEER